jgi:hypothetical protein
MRVRPLGGPIGTLGAQGVCLDRLAKDGLGPRLVRMRSLLREAP